MPKQLKASQAVLTRRMAMAESKARAGVPIRENLFPEFDPDAGTEFSSQFFRSLDKPSDLDLPPERLRRGQSLCYLTYHKNVRGKRATELINDFVWGSGVRFKAEDPTVQKLLDEHWALNEWDRKWPERLRCLSIFGEAVYPAFVRDGVLDVSFVNPLRIKRIRRDAQDADILTHVGISVLRKKEKKKKGGKVPPGATKGGQLEDIRWFKIVRAGAEFEGDEDRAFYFPLNRVAGATRGNPDLLASLDWLEGLDQFLFGLLERGTAAQNIVWDLTYEGLDEAQIKKKIDAFIALQHQGGVFGHNEKTTLEIKAPELGSSEAQGITSVILKQIQAGTGLAGLFFGDADDLTRASAGELTIPVAKLIQVRQSLFRAIIAEVFRYQIEVGVEAGRLKADVSRKVAIKLSPVYLRDMNTVAETLVKLSTALLTAREEGWIAKDQAGEVFRAAMQQLAPEHGERVGLEEPAVVEPEPTPYERALDRRALPAPPVAPAGEPEEPERPEERALERLNGAQISAILSVVQQVAEGVIPRESGVALVVEGLQIPADVVERIIPKGQTAGAAG